MKTRVASINIKEKKKPFLAHRDEIGGAYAIPSASASASGPG